MNRAIDRRKFLGAFAAAAACLALSAKTFAQQPGSPRRIGVLLVAWSPAGDEAQAFRQGLVDHGYVEGRDVVIEWRWAEGDYTRVPDLAAELVQSKVDVLVTDTTIGTRALQRATTTIPIVMTTIADPVGAGFAASLARPGGNITGHTTMIAEVCARRLRLVKEAIPALSRIAVLWNRDTPYNAKVIEALKADAAASSMDVVSMGIRTPDEIVPVLSALREVRAEALYLIGDAMFNINRATILKLVAKARIPAIYGFRVYVEEGGLISYGPSFRDLFRRSAGYVDKILRGAPPGDLPIAQPTKFELVVNLKTAKTLGITIPDPILMRADEVIR